MNVTILDSHIRSLDENELGKYFMDKIVALEEKSISENMETDVYDSKLNDLIQEYKHYLK